MHGLQNIKIVKIFLTNHPRETEYLL